MTEKSKNESIKRKLYATLYRFGIITSSFDSSQHQNIYIDDSGYVMVIMPDGVIDVMGPLSFSGEFICRTAE